jgi:hypothetical protein
MSSYGDSVADLFYRCPTWLTQRFFMTEPTVLISLFLFFDRE